MLNRLLNNKDFQATLDRLTGNPLLTSLFLLSPPAALEYIGASWLAVPFQGMHPVRPADQQQVQHILQALKAGHTSLEEPQLIRPPQTESVPEIRLEPSGPDASLPSLSKPVPEPDFVVQVPEKTIQFLLNRYTDKHAVEPTFTVMNGSWMEARVRLVSMHVSLQSGTIQAIICLQATFILLVGGRPGPHWNTLLEIDVLTGVSVNASHQLCLDIGKGRIRLRETRLPVTMANELVSKITTAMPTIPLVNVASMLPDTQDYLDGEFMVTLSSIAISATAITLEFQLFHSPGEAQMVTVPLQHLCPTCRQRVCNHN